MGLFKVDQNLVTLHLTIALTTLALNSGDTEGKLSITFSPANIQCSSALNLLNASFWLKKKKKDLSEVHQLLSEFFNFNSEVLTPLPC